MPSRDKRAEARKVLEEFWGRSNGGHEAWSRCVSRLKELDLSETEIRVLRRNLPVPEISGSVTAAKIARAGQILDTLASGD